MISRMVCEESRAWREGRGAAAHLPSFTSSGHLCHSLVLSSARARDGDSQAAGCKQAVMLHQMMLKDFKENRNENVKPVKLWSAFTRTWAEGLREVVLKIGARGDCSHNGTVLVPMPRWGTVHSAFYRSQKEKSEPCDAEFMNPLKKAGAPNLAVISSRALIVSVSSL